MGEKVAGRRYGRLVILHSEKVRLKSNSRNTYYRCKCDCGREVTVASPNLYQGRTSSCGKHNESRGSNRRKKIIYEGKEITVKDFAKLTPYNEKYVFLLLRQGKKPEEITEKKVGLRQKVANKYGKTRQWVSLQLKKGRTIEEKNGEVMLV